MPFPNPDTQFQPGQSGNPAGKPKGARHLSSVIQELMDDENFELKLKDGKILKGRPSRKLTEVMYALAVSGNVKAAEWLAKHGYGIKQVHEITDPVKAILDKFDIDPNSEGTDARQTTDTESAPPKSVS